MGRALRERFAELEPAERPVRAEDFVIVDMRSTVHGEEVPEASRTDYLYYVGSGEFGPSSTTSCPARSPARS